ncbi:MAG: alpha/beta hydrolase [Vampirovibrionales bacterium]
MMMSSATLFPATSGNASAVTLEAMSTSLPVQENPPPQRNPLACPLTLAWHDHQFKTSDGLWFTFHVAHPQHPHPTGRACLFFMGLGGSNLVARPFFEHLSAGFDTLVVLDLRGFGHQRFAFDTLRSFKQLWNDANALWQHLRQHPHPIFETNHPQEWTLMGLSLGGLLATLLAKQHPQQFQRLCLLAPAFKPNAQRFPPTFIAQTLWRWLTGQAPVMTLPYGLDAITRQAELVKSIFSQYWPEFATKANQPVQQPTRFMLSVLPYQWLAQWQLPRLTQATCWVIPEADTVIDSQQSVKLFEKLAWPYVGQHQLLLYPHCYHDVVLEPELAMIADDIHHWLKLT